MTIHSPQAKTPVQPLCTQESTPYIAGISSPKQFSSLHGEYFEVNYFASSLWPSSALEIITVSEPISKCQERLPSAIISVVYLLRHHLKKLRLASIVLVMPGMEPRAACMFVKYSTMNYTPKPKTRC